METLQIVSFENTEVSSWDFEMLKAELQHQLDKYAGIIYTDETVKEAKNDRAILNKVKKAISDAEKVYKAKCLEPYESVKPQIKELIDLVENQRSLIDSTVKDFENRQKLEKEQNVRKYYDRKSIVLGDFAKPLYEKLFDSKWTNASTSKVKYEEAIQIAINKAEADIAEIKSWDSSFVNTLLEVYVLTLSVEKAMEKNTELIESVKKAGITEQPKQVETVVDVAEKLQKVNEENGVAMKVYASKSQLNQICDFMKAIGVEYVLF